jgi:MFS family permease
MSASGCRSCSIRGAGCEAGASIALIERPDMLRRTASRLAHGLRGLPRQFWLLVAGTFVFLIGIDMCFPFETLYLTQRMDISMTTIGLIIGVVSFVGVPFQIPGGALTDRLGRRPLMAVGIFGTIQLYLGIAFAPALWVIVLVFTIEAIAGWSIYLTASNAMIADTVPFERRAEAYSLIRTAVSAGAAIGPLFAALILSTSDSFRLSFVIGGSVCVLYLLMVLTLFKETRPGRGASERGDAGLEAPGTIRSEAEPEPAAPTAPQPTPPVENAEIGHTRGGYTRVMRDHHFLLFLAAALLPMYCFAQIWVTLPVLLNDLYGTSPQTWGLLLSLYSVVSAVIQYPLVRMLRRHDSVGLIALGCLLMGAGLGGLAFAGYGWPTVLFMLVLAVGVVLFMPLVPTVVSHMAPADLRGRYMGVWTIVFVCGYGLGPLLGGQAMDALGPRGAYLVVTAVGVCGALAFGSLAVARRRRPVLREAGQL